MICYFLKSACYNSCWVTTLFWRREVKEDNLGTMAVHGKMTAFNPQVEDWLSYEERLQFYLIANKVTNAARKRAILLNVCGTQTYKLLRSLLPEGTLNTKSYEELVQLLQKHYDPKPLPIVQRLYFNTRTRTSGELMADYVAALRGLVLHCTERSFRKC